MYGSVLSPVDSGVRPTTGVFTAASTGPCTEWCTGAYADRCITTQCTHRFVTNGDVHSGVHGLVNGPVHHGIHGSVLPPVDGGVLPTTGAFTAASTGCCTPSKIKEAFNAITRGSERTMVSPSSWQAGGLQLVATSDHSGTHANWLGQKARRVRQKRNGKPTKLFFARFHFERRGWYAPVRLECIAVPSRVVRRRPKPLHRHDSHANLPRLYCYLSACGALINSHIRATLIGAGRAVGSSISNCKCTDAVKSTAGSACL